MSFAYPLGLLGLIGIPILIIIYIIKNKHTEQIIPSTYLWTLSEKFLKKKKPISLISGIISLILQIIAVIVISLAIAHPVITIPNSAKEYCFILDGSGSMNMESEESSRIELGKDKIEEIITKSQDGSKYTLVFVSSTTKVVYEKLGDKEKAVELLNKLEPAGITVSYNGTLKYVQEYYNQNRSLVTYLVTDRDYSSENINVINVSNHEDNYALLDVDYVENTFTIDITGNVISYESDKLLTLEFYVDDKLENSQEIQVTKLTDTAFSYKSPTLDFSKIEVKIKDEDGLMLDNSNIMYNVEKDHSYSTLIVSYRPFYLESVIKTIGNSSVTVVSGDDYDPTVSGYSLYIFDSVNPTVLPSDGTVWLFGVSSSIDGAGFSVQDVIEDEEGMELVYPKNSTSQFKLLTANLTKEPIFVSKYIKYGVYKQFTTLLTHEGNPIVFTGLTSQGNREVVFAFDLHDSNLPLLMDYLMLSKNLLDFSFPIILDESSYICGDTLRINVLSNCDSIRVESPLGNITYLDVSSEMAELTLNEAGSYVLRVMIGEEEKVFNVFSSLPEEESSSNFQKIDFSLQGELENNYTDGIYDKLIILFIILAIIYIADWMVYCYEQYQLR